MKMKIRYLCVCFLLSFPFTIAILLWYMYYSAAFVKNYPLEGESKVLLGTIYPSEHCSYTLGYPLEISFFQWYRGISLENITTEQIESVLISLTLENEKIESFVHPESVNESDITFENWRDIILSVYDSDGLCVSGSNHVWLIFSGELEASPVEVKITLTLKEKTDKAIKVYVVHHDNSSFFFL